jgi:hypothetical protein
VSALAEVVGSIDASLVPYALPELPRGRWEERLRDDPDRAFVLEAVYEGFLLHYREPRAFAGMDSDMRLLAGDALYALGLERLAQTGDIEAVAELADLISLCAQAEAAGRPDLTGELWEASLRALSPGGGPGARAAVGDRLAQADGFPLEHTGS